MEKELLENKTKDELVELALQFQECFNGLESQNCKLKEKIDGYELLFDCIKKFINEYEVIDKKNFTNLNKQMLADCLISNISSYLNLFVLVNKK